MTHSMDYEAALEEADGKIRACGDVDALKRVEREYLGRKGTLATLLASIGKLQPQQRKTVGEGANRL